MKTLALSGIITTILLDAIIAFLLCAFLFQHRDVETKQTRTLVKKVGIYAVNTGLASSVMSIFNLAMVSLSQAESSQWFNRILLRLCAVPRISKYDDLPQFDHDLYQG